MTLDADDLEAAAREQTGLSDFGDGHHREGLERLVASMNDEADLTDSGELMQRIRLSGTWLPGSASRPPTASIPTSKNRRSRGRSS